MKTYFITYFITYYITFYYVFYITYVIIIRLLLTLLSYSGNIAEYNNNKRLTMRQLIIRGFL